jgi:signal transduction histidine kinase
VRLGLAVLVLTLWTGSTAAASPGVLVLFSDERAFAAAFEAEGALRTALGLPAADIEYSSEYLDLARFPEAAANGAWRDFLLAKYSGRDIRTIIVAGTGAFDFMARNRAELFPSAPMLVFAVPGYMLETRTVPGNTVVLPFDYDLAGTVKAARQLQPNAREVVVAIGTTAADEVWKQRVLQTVGPAAGNLPVRFLSGLTLDEMKSEVAELPADVIHLLVPIYRDSTGRIRLPRESMLELALSSGAPSYSVFNLGEATSIVGGAVISFEDMGRWAGQLALRLIAGETTAEIARTPPMQATFVADWRQLDRWGLDESRLPPGSRVRYRLPNAWQEYRGPIVITLLLLTLLAVAIAALLLQRYRRDEAEIQVLHHRNELAHLTRVSLVGELSASIAHELHQPLTAILSNAQAAQRFLQAPMPDLKLIREILADIATDDRRAGDVIQRLRELLKKGEPKFEPVECAALVDSVVRLAKGDLHARVVAVTIEMSGNLPPVLGDQVQLQQVLLNLLVNAGDALRDLPPAERSVRITAGRGDTGTVVFAVADRGHGIPDTAQSQLFQPFFTTKTKGLGMGLAISRSIAEAHRGQLWATNNPDRGATFFLKLPVARS